MQMTYLRCNRTLELQLYDEGNITTCGPLVSNCRLLHETFSHANHCCPRKEGGGWGGVCKSALERRLVSQETRVDKVMEISEREADETMRALARVEGIFAGMQPFLYHVSW